MCLNKVAFQYLVWAVNSFSTWIFDVKHGQKKLDSIREARHVPREPEWGKHLGYSPENLEK